MKIANIITIPKIITGKDELVILPRKIFERLISSKTRNKVHEVVLIKRQVKAEDVLEWSDEAKRLKKEGKLSVLRSLKDLR